jgi:hypothetical protein
VNDGKVLAVTVTQAQRDQEKHFALHAIYLGAFMTWCKTMEGLTVSHLP